MAPIHEQKCPNCGAALRFEPNTQKLFCDFCDSSFEIAEFESAQNQPQSDAQNEEELQGFDYNSLTDQITQIDADNLPVYACVSCGADVIADPEQSSLTCPYCGNNIVLTDKVSGQLRPDGVIPFKITSDKLPEAVNRFYKGKKLLPKGFFSNSTMGNITGVYAPFWVFDGKISGNLSFNAERTHSHRSGDYIITNIDHYQLVRDASIAFDNLPVDAGEKIDNKLMDSLEPFDTKEAKPFDMRYLAGFTADRFDEKKSTVSDRARHRMRTTALDAINRNAGNDYGNVSYSGGRLNADLNAKYLLFPVYLFNIEHAGKSYPFAVNGQTGKVVGQLPIDKKTSTGYFLKRFGIISGILIIYSVLKYFIGW